MLELRDVHVNRSRLPILKGITLNVTQGQIVSLLGPNGAGKTTLLHAISGTLPCVAGQIHFAERRIDGTDPAEIVRLGLGHVPQDRELFADMTVRENLEVGALAPGKRARLRERLDEVFGYFPVLRERIRQLAGTLSGGEQQMLAIARALMGAPHVLMLDEPSGGLAPRVVAGIGELMARLRRDGLTILLVEQNIPMALGIADYAYVVVNGEIRVHGTAERARGDWDFAALYLRGARERPGLARGS
jgi:branched-chain amino acid transport system ATP-binding protein